MFVASQMGYSSWEMIARVYGQWIPENGRGSGDQIRGVWSQRETPKIFNIHRKIKIIGVSEGFRTPNPWSHSPVLCL